MGSTAYVRKMSTPPTLLRCVVLLYLFLLCPAVCDKTFGIADGIHFLICDQRCRKTFGQFPGTISMFLVLVLRIDCLETGCR